MQINEAKLASLDACDKGDLETFREYPGLKDGYAELGGFCRWVAAKQPKYVFWLLTRLMTPEGAITWAVLAAKRHYCADTVWTGWATKWLANEDRTPESAVTAVRATEAADAAVLAAAHLSHTAHAAVQAARAAAWAFVHLAHEPWQATWAADNAAAHAYDAAEDKDAEISAQISSALEILDGELK